jgi:hypothetical protein
MSSKFHVGQRVVAVVDLWDGPTEDHPGGYYARVGEELIVRKVDGHYQMPIHVSHDDVLDSTFCVREDEISESSAKQR